MSMWDTVGTDESQLESSLSKVEICRSVLSLFIPSSGIFKTALGKVFSHLLSTIDLLEAEVRRPGQGTSLVPLDTDEPNLAASIADDLRSSRIERQLVAQSERNLEKENALRQTVAELRDERDKLADLICFQQSRRIKFESPSASTPSAAEMISSLAAERESSDLKIKCEASEQQLFQATQQIMALRVLNGKYAVQATELAARMLVIQDHNERMATSLAIQQEELMRLEKENVVLKSELSDFSSVRSAPKLLDPSEEIIAETRDVAFAFGTNLAVPKQLQSSELVFKCRMTKETAVLTVHDILVSRGSQRAASDFCSFVSNYFGKRHGPQAISWAYSLDECTRLYEAEYNLNAFGQVSRKVLSEHFYTIVNSDILLFLKACESLDRQTNGDPRHILSCAQVLLILYELFPSYAEGGFTRLMDALDGSSVASNVHYQMLFPNMDRMSLADISAPVSAIEVRPENTFSNTFKELILDDAVTTTQLMVDSLLALPGHKVSILGLGDALESSIADERIRTEMSLVLRSVFDKVLARTTNQSDLTAAHFGPDVAVPKGDIVHFLRTGVVLRRGVLKGNCTERPLLNQYVSTWRQTNALIPPDALSLNFDVQRRTAIDE